MIAGAGRAARHTVEADDEQSRWSTCPVRGRQRRVSYHAATPWPCVPARLDGQSRRQQALTRYHGGGARPSDRSSGEPRARAHRSRTTATAAACGCRPWQRDGNVTSGVVKRAGLDTTAGRLFGNFIRDRGMFPVQSDRICSDD